jgi:hypothetical protein
MLVVNKDYISVERFMKTTYDNLEIDKLIPAAFYIPNGEPVFPIEIKEKLATMHVRNGYSYQAKESVIDDYIKEHPKTTLIYFDARLDKVVYDGTECKFIDPKNWSYYIPADKTVSPEERVILGKNGQMFKLYGSTNAPLFIFLGYMLQKLITPIDLQPAGLRFVCNYISRYYGRGFITEYQMKDKYPPLFAAPMGDTPAYSSEVPWRDFDKVTLKIQEKNAVTHAEKEALKQEDDDDEDEDKDTPSETKSSETIVEIRTVGGQPSLNPFGGLPIRNQMTSRVAITNSDTISLLELVGQEITEELEYFSVIVPDDFNKKLYNGYILEGFLYLTVKVGETLTSAEQEEIEEALQIKYNNIIFLDSTHSFLQGGG